MIRAIWYLLFLALIVWGAAVIADQPGDVRLDWLGYRVETSTSVLVTTVILISVILAVFYRMWVALRRAPRRIILVRSDWRRRRGYKALTQGMVAIAAGDAVEARRQAHRAESLLAEPPLTMLLSAQAAQLSGDNEAAGRFFQAMSEQKETKYLGLHGRLNQAMQAGDAESALKLAEQAQNLRPKTDTVSTTLLDLQIQRGSWAEAEDTVRKAVRDKHLDTDTGRRMRAVLLFLQSTEADTEGRRNDALQLVRRANGFAPSFTPAGVRLAELLASSGKRRRAIAMIEESWVSSPHPQLVQVLEEIGSGTGIEERLRAAEKLARYNPNHLESHLAVGRAALAAGRWPEAREHLEAAANDNPPARVCRYMAELEEAEFSDMEKSRDWLKKATDADPDSAWICDHCGEVEADWQPICSRCENFDTLQWGTPPRVTRMAEDEVEVGDTVEAEETPATKQEPSSTKLG